ncbi:MAG: glycosyltransferase family 39 protein [Microgenomates group bacterium]|jgi:4-amino-4-deoxy-L-arabinose transferase-like glycosyltransferase
MIYKGSIKRFFQSKIDSVIVALLALSLPLFFYKLGQSSLENWDEAWYGEIAKNIFHSGDFLNLTFNGSPYFDHPPFVFWLMSLTYKIFGVSEFWTRFASAGAGFLCIVILYFLGKELFNRTVGFASAVALSSAIWFVYRARSGNLDVILTTLFVLTFYLAFKAVKNKKFLIPFSVSLSCLFLTKSMVPFTIILSLLLIFWGNKNYKIKEYVIPLLIFILSTGVWFIDQLINQPNFTGRYLSIGLPGLTTETSYLNNFNLAKGYLHSGIGKWFWPGVFSMFLGLFLFQKRFFVFSLFFLVFFIPLIFSTKGQIWHLIPLHPFLILMFFGASSFLLEKIIKNRILVTILLIGISFYFSFMQIRQIWFQFIDIPAFISDEAILSKEAGLYSDKFYIDGDFVPVAVFYSGREVEIIRYNGLKTIFSYNQPFLLITVKWRLDEANIPESRYRIIKTDRDKILIQGNINE